ncbi:MAG TPA: hypothetical protein VEB20_18330 [Azospirillaceae bacterium]|nr:hypothetical protein [Azospirillaceae bacterium]
MRRGETCYNCRFWVGFGVRERGPKGQCRRYPPVVTGRAPAGAFPTTLTTDWCGEWQRHAARAAAPSEEQGSTLYDEL